MKSPKTIARMAGVLYLSMVLFSAFGLAVRSRIIESGDAAATAENIRASVMLFRLAFVSNLVSNVCFLFTAMVLYLLLKDVDRLAAAAMVTLVAVSVAIGYLNLLNDYATLTLATNEHYAVAFGRAGSEGLVMLFEDVQTAGGAIDELFWGLWLLPLGYLVMKSAYFPRVLGAALIVGGGSWLAQFLMGLLAPDLGAAEGFLAIGAAIEFGFMGWLLTQPVKLRDCARPLAAQA
jgi:hypothetical protein